MIISRANQTIDNDSYKLITSQNIEFFAIISEIKFLRSRIEAISRTEADTNILIQDLKQNQFLN